MLSNGVRSPCHCAGLRISNLVIRTQMSRRVMRGKVIALPVWRPSRRFPLQLDQHLNSFVCIRMNICPGFGWGWIQIMYIYIYIVLNSCFCIYVQKNKMLINPVWFHYFPYNNKRFSQIPPMRGGHGTGIVNDAFSTIFVHLILGRKCYRHIWS